MTFLSRQTWRPDKGEIAYHASSGSVRGWFAKSLIIWNGTTGYQWQAASDGAPKGCWVPIKNGDVLVLESFFDRVANLGRSQAKSAWIVAEGNITLSFERFEVYSREGLPVQCSVMFDVALTVGDSLDTSIGSFFNRFQYLHGVVTERDVAEAVARRVEELTSRVIAQHTVADLQRRNDVERMVDSVLREELQRWFAERGLRYCSSRALLEASHKKTGSIFRPGGVAWIAPTARRDDPAKSSPIERLYPTDADLQEAVARANRDRSPRRRAYWCGIGWGLLAATLLLVLALGLCLLCMKRSEEVRLAAGYAEQVGPASPRDSKTWEVPEFAHPLLHRFCPRFCEQLRKMIPAPLVAPCTRCDPAPLPPPEPLPPVPKLLPAVPVGGGLGLAVAVLSNDHEWVCGLAHRIRRSGDGGAAAKLPLGDLTSSLQSLAADQRVARAVAFVAVGAASEEGRRSAQHALAEGRATELQKLVQNSEVTKVSAQSARRPTFRWSVGQALGDRHTKCGASADDGSPTGVQRRVVVLMLECLEASCPTFPKPEEPTFRPAVQEKLRVGAPALSDFPFRPGDYSGYTSRDRIELAE